MKRSERRAILTRLPPGLVDGLPREDQDAISNVIGKRIRLIGYDEIGRAELEFREKNGTSHKIWVKPDFIRIVD